MKKHDIDPFHYVLHLLSAVAVFCAGVAADIVIMEIRHDVPKRVQWASGQVQSDFRFNDRMIPAVTNRVEFGMTSDGTVVWRILK